jgi:hypothetical protein
VARRLLTCVAAALLLVGVGAGVSGAIGGNAAEWDPAVVDLVAFVEAERGLRFEHPVPVAVLRDDEFAAEVGRAARSADADDGRQAAELRALGLTSGHDSGTLANVAADRYVGMYRPSTGRIVVRAARSAPASTPSLMASPAARATLVHELTHALDDQHHDLARLGGSRAETDGERFARRAVIEASALLVERAYLDAMSQADRDAHDRELEARRRARTKHDGAARLLAMPYVAGRTFVDAVAATRPQSPGVIDDLLRMPPVSEKQVRWPETFLAGERPVHVDAPALRETERRTAEASDVGAITLETVLAPHVGDERAAAAGRSWRGSAATHYGRADGTACLRIAFAIAGAAVVATAGAVADAAARLPDATAEHDGRGRVVLDACDVSRRR